MPPVAGAPAGPPGRDLEGLDYVFPAVEVVEERPRDHIPVAVAELLLFPFRQFIELGVVFFFQIVVVVHRGRDEDTGLDSSSFTDLDDFLEQGLGRVRVDKVLFQPRVGRAAGVGAHDKTGKSPLTVFRGLPASQS